MRKKAIMVVGTGSDVGKSLVTTALCRYFAEKGEKVAPFKGQNMALNSYITIDGKEIGRAQGLQAEAAKVIATKEMNPILLKPTSDHKSQIIVLGEVWQTLDFRHYREEYYDYLREVVRKSLHKLQAEFERVIIEGAGSPVEMNLKERDLVNMQVAEWADADLILVADIDRGGVFAQVVGTLQLLTESERKRVKGIIINKFRGDLSLFTAGKKWLEEYTGIPVIGVLPWIDLTLWEEEDSVALIRKRKVQAIEEERRKEEELLKIAVLKLPFLSNYTDFIPLELEAGVNLYYVESVEDFGKPHVVIIPGTKNTVLDLEYLKKSGLAEKIHQHVLASGELVGICGGYQMLSEKLYDPDGVESNNKESIGLGYFPMTTTFYREKKTVQVTGETIENRFPIYGYELHMGMNNFSLSIEPLFKLSDGTYEGAKINNVWGTFIHGIFQGDQFRKHWINTLRHRYNLKEVTNNLKYEERKEEMFQQLVDHFRKHVNIEEILKDEEK